MTVQQVHVCERLKRLGFTKQGQITLYGSRFALVSDPLVMGNDLVLVDEVDQKSGLLRRVRIPLMIVKVATEETLAA